MTIKKAGIYLDTSVISALFDDRTPERKAMTSSAWMKFAEFDVFISSIVIEELAAMKDPTAKRITDTIADFTVLPITPQVELLAQQYLQRGIFPDKYYDDALHVACASVNQIPYVLSWNFKHLVKVKTRRFVSLTNALLDYPPVEIIAPPEL